MTEAHGKTSQANRLKAKPRQHTEGTEAHGKASTTETAEEQWTTA